MYTPRTCMWVHVHVQVLCIHTAFQHVQANLNICKISTIVVESLAFNETCADTSFMCIGTTESLMHGSDQSVSIL